MRTQWNVLQNNETQINDAILELNGGHGIRRHRYMAVCVCIESRVKSSRRICTKIPNENPTTWNHKAALTKFNRNKSAAVASSFFRLRGVWKSYYALQCSFHFLSISAAINHTVYGRYVLTRYARNRNGDRFRCPHTQTFAKNFCCCCLSLTCFLVFQRKWKFCDDISCLA